MLNRLWFFARLALAGLAALGATACATTMPAPERPGQMGQITRADKKVMGVQVSVYAPAADHCTYDGAESFRKRANGYHDFLFVSGTYSNPETAKIECRTADGKALDREVKAPFNEDAFRLSRTAGTIGAIIGGGPLGLISGPLAAELTKNTFRQPPVLIHVPTPDQLATDEARQAAREAAVGRWSDLGAMLERECDPKQRSKEVVMGYACAKGFFAVLRDIDLSVFDDESTPTETEPTVTKVSTQVQPVTEPTPAEQLSAP